MTTINAIISGPVNSPCQYKSIILFGGSNFKDQLNTPNAKYIIKHDFNLNGETVTIPENCILAIDGGSIANGILVGNHTVLLNVNKVNNILNNVTLSGTWGQTETSYEADNLSLLYLDKNTKKILYWNGTTFVEVL